MFVVFDIWFIDDFGCIRYKDLFVVDEFLWLEIRVLYDCLGLFIGELRLEELGIFLKDVIGE